VGTVTVGQMCFQPSFFQILYKVKVNVMVKHSLYRRGQAQRVPGS